MAERHLNAPIVPRHSGDYSIPMDARSNERFDKALNSAIEKASWQEKHMTNKSMIVEWYQDTYSEKTWRDHLAKDWLKALGKDPTHKNINTFRRRVEGKRIDAPVRQGRTKEEWAALGKTLPPYKVPRKLEGRGARVKGKGDVKFSDGYPTERKWDIHIDSDLMQKLLDGARMDAVMEGYGISPDAIDEISNLDIDFEFDD